MLRPFRIHDPIAADNVPQLASLCWSSFFAGQLEPADAALVPVRVSVVHRSRLLAETGTGAVKLGLQGATMNFAVGDWVLMDPGARTTMRRLERRTLLRRRTESAHVPQLIAANVDTLFIVTSCNDDFNVARLERYLAFANEAGGDPVIILTKVIRRRTCSAIACGPRPCGGGFASSR